MIINEDFFDDHKIDTTEEHEIEDSEIMDTQDYDAIKDSYDFRYELYFNITYYSGQKTYDYYIERVDYIVKAVNYFLDNSSIFPDHTELFLFATHPVMCNDSIKLGDYTIRYENRNTTYAHGLAFNPDRIIIGFYTNHKILNVSRFNRLINFMFKNLTSIKLAFSCSELMVENMKRKNSKNTMRSLNVCTFDSIKYKNSQGNLENYIQKYADVLNVCGKPGIVSQWIKLNNLTTDVSNRLLSGLSSYKIVEKHNCSYKPFKFDYADFVIAGTKESVLSVTVDWNYSMITDVFTNKLELSHDEISELLEKAGNQMEDNSAKYTLKSCRTSGGDDIEYFIIFYDTVVYKDIEFGVYFKYIDDAEEWEVDPAAVKLLMTAGYDFDEATDRQIYGKWTTPQNREKARQMIENGEA